MTYVYNRDKEQKLGGVFSERVPAPTRIFYAEIKDFVFRKVTGMCHQISLNAFYRCVIV